ncbi:hypothetical protein LEP1GSC168_1728 [Leptospira santarosai str. HAI134]|nr:hypothetical protein LEP1GSC168_1728 [Leptospira santarosai str. HAI134]
MRPSCGSLSSLERLIQSWERVLPKDSFYLRDFLLISTE